MATDTDARSGDVPSTSAARAEADDALAASKRMHFTYARHYLPPSSPTVTDQPPSLASLGLTPLVDPRAVPDVLRAVLLEDGCVKVNFRDNAVLRLDPTGSAFTVTTPEGETLRQLSEFAVTRFARKLRSALEFRNAHADVPFLPPAIARLAVDEDDGVSPEGKKTDLRFRASARARARPPRAPTRFDGKPFNKGSMAASVIATVAGGAGVICFAAFFQNKKHGFIK